MEHVNNCGFIQSVLYTMLYEDIFQLFDASEAAQFMLSDSPNKPEIYQKEFTGMLFNHIDRCMQSPL